MTALAATQKRPMGRLAILTVPELAERWAVSDQTIFREIYAKRLKAFRVGRQYRVYLSSVEAVERRLQ